MENLPEFAQLSGDAILSPLLLLSDGACRRVEPAYSTPQRLQTFCKRHIRDSGVDNTVTPSTSDRSLDWHSSLIPPDLCRTMQRSSLYTSFPVARKDLHCAYCFAMRCSRNDSEWNRLVLEKGCSPYLDVSLPKHGTAGDPVLHSGTLGVSYDVAHVR